MSNDTELTSDQEARRQTAMYALMGQAFGFTREDVTAIRACADSTIKQGELLSERPDLSNNARWHFMENARLGAELLRSIAARIEALLPPNG